MCPLRKLASTRCVDPKIGYEKYTKVINKTLRKYYYHYYYVCVIILLNYLYEILLNYIPQCSTAGEKQKKNGH